MEIPLVSRTLEAPQLVSWRWREANISRRFASKIIVEVEAGKLIDPASTKSAHGRRPGSRLFTYADEAALLYRRERKPTRTLSSYRRKLYQITGTLASEATICKWFLYRFEIKGGMRVSSLAGACGQVFSRTCFAHEEIHRDDLKNGRKPSEIR